VSRGGLGRGLSAIIPSDVRGGVGRYREVPTESIRPNPHQPRKSFDEERIAELAESIREVGLLQPLIVRELPEGGYELVAGERRLRAAKRLGLPLVPAVVVEAEGPESLEKALVENVQRADLNPMEEAGAYAELVERFGLTHEQIAKRVGKSRAAVSNKLRLLQLPETVQMFVREGRLTEGHARALLATSDREQQVELAREAVEKQLSVRELEAFVRARQGEVVVGGEASERKEASPVTEEARDEFADVYMELERVMSERLNTRVKVESGRSRGRIVIEFSGLEDLERLSRLICR
jgi:ParB family chromosome partitioning protein